MGGAKTRSASVASLVSRWGTAWAVLSAVRLLGAAVNVIGDCDETFNYWEPVHHLVYGGGLQTWEYAPRYALRSWLYAGAHAAVGWVLAAMGLSKPAVFYGIRAALGVGSAACEATLVAAVAARHGERLAAGTLFFMAVSPGPFQAGTALLPSSFAMCATSVAVAAWMGGNRQRAVWAVGVGAILGWPFAALAGLPIALHALAMDGAAAVARWMAAAAAATVLPGVGVDSLAYGRAVVSPLNLLLYNTGLGAAAGGGGGDARGAHLYGTEPAGWYLRNLANNFTLGLPLALALPVLTLARRRRTRSAAAAAAGGGAARPRAPGGGRTTAALMLHLSPLYLWLGFFSAMPHKEERFMYVVYPLLCVAAAAGLREASALAADLAGWLASRSSPRAEGALRHAAGVASVALVSAAVAALGASRVAAVVDGYGAPALVHARFAASPLAASAAAAAPGATVCLGSAWFRFPSSFFLPAGLTHVTFLPGSHGGALPGRFASTSTAAPWLNDENRAVPEQFVSDPSTCTVVAGADPAAHPRGSRPPTLSSPLLDTGPAWTRALYVPFGVSRARNRYTPYALWVF